jgi:uncharacterized protein (DUF58 family)
MAASFPPPTAACAEDPKFDRILRASAYFPYVPPMAELRANLPLRLDRRGRYQQDKIGVATRFPFAFLRKMRRIALARQVVAYPSVEPTNKFFHAFP